MSTYTGNTVTGGNVQLGNINHHHEGLGFWSCAALAAICGVSVEATRRVLNHALGPSCGPLLLIHTYNPETIMRLAVEAKHIRNEDLARALTVELVLVRKLKSLKPDARHRYLEKIASKDHEAMSALKKDYLQALPEGLLDRSPGVSISTDPSQAFVTSGITRSTSDGDEESIDRELSSGSFPDADLSSLLQRDRVRDNVTDSYSGRPPFGMPPPILVNPLIITGQGFPQDSALKEEYQPLPTHFHEPGRILETLWVPPKAQSLNEETAAHAWYIKFLAGPYVKPDDNAHAIRFIVIMPRGPSSAYCFIISNYKGRATAHPRLDKDQRKAHALIRPRICEEHRCTDCDLPHSERWRVQNEPAAFHLPPVVTDGNVTCDHAIYRDDTQRIVLTHAFQFSPEIPVRSLGKVMPESLKVLQEYWLIYADRRAQLDP